MNDRNFITKAIEDHIRSEISKAIEEEIENVQQVISDRIRGSVDKIALQVAQQYSVVDNAHHVIIDVRKAVD